MKRSVGKAVACSALAITVTGTLAACTSTPSVDSYLQLPAASSD